MIDSLISLSIAMHRHKGAYALLIGSGVSRPAEIPTGWEIVLDLIRSLARLKNEDCGENPAGWYEQTFGAAPTYDVLLGSLAKTPAERRQFLARYFEPTPEERERGAKVPTAAHRAIAELVELGYVRIILTTNFDHLTERAIEAVGSVPTVLSSADAIQGALPLAHQACCIIKLHGDYLDTRLKNTTDELSGYDRPQEQLLDRILDEYGLVICGWSADWDTALRHALERCSSHRFTTFWATRGELGPLAQSLATLRRAELVRIRDADDFFGRLRENIRALTDLDTNHPLTSKMAAATVKRYAVDDRHRIELHDLVLRETERVAAHLTQNEFSFNGGDIEELRRQVRRYESITEVLLALVAQGCYWTGSEHRRLWVDSLRRIANGRREEGGDSALCRLRFYPALLLLYAGGLASIASDRYDRFTALAANVTAKDYGKEQPLIMVVNAWTVVDEGGRDVWPDMKTHVTPVSTHLQQILRPHFSDLIGGEDQYSLAFDKFEYFAALVYADINKGQGNAIRGPVGRFGWRRTREVLFDQVQQEAAAAADSWPPLTAGLFGGSSERFLAIKWEFDQFARGLNWH
jgi:SIR2-like protein